MACLVDTSVWIAFAFDRHSSHSVARTALDSVTVKTQALFCRATQQSFLRLASTPAVFRRYGVAAFSNASALVVLSRIESVRNVAFHDEPEGMVPLWHRLANRDSASPNVWMDAYLAAFAIQAGLTFLSLDAGFRQFEPAGLQLQLLPGS